MRGRFTFVVILLILGAVAVQSRGFSAIERDIEALEKDAKLSLSSRAHARSHFVEDTPRLEDVKKPNIATRFKRWVSAGFTMEFPTCRIEEPQADGGGDPYIPKVMRLAGTNFQGWKAMWAGKVNAARGSLTDAQASKYRGLFKVTPNSPVDGLSVPASLCRGVPPEAMAYAMTVQEGCYDRKAMKIEEVASELREFNVPTPASECRARIVRGRMFHDSNGDTPGGARPKGILAEATWDKILYVTFRATDESIDWTEIDFKLGQVDFAVNGKTYGKVHRGFYQAFMGLEKDFGISSSVRDYVGRGYRVVVTGLSLGAALSTVAAHYLKIAVPNGDISVINFGSPRVGDEAFVGSFDQKIASVTRAVSLYNCAGKETTDIVTTLPPKSGQTGEDSSASMLATKGIFRKIIGGAKAIAMKVAGAAVGTVKDAATLAAGAIWKYKHVKGIKLYRDPALPTFKCSNRIERLKIAASIHGWYRRYTESELLVWAWKQSA